MSSLALRDIERSKIECARKFLAKLTKASAMPNVRYDAVDSYSKLMELVNA